MYRGSPRVAQALAVSRRCLGLGREIEELCIFSGSLHDYSFSGFRKQVLLAQDGMMSCFVFFVHAGIILAFQHYPRRWHQVGWVCEGTAGKQRLGVA
ncbi:uncharacterized protein M421DRAFT_202021 [Didymella exigua CBS 183.55]|uniref:Uncharacterized protein n=1 Tax=Didymella exigua CBS 183.55 TaxID=1150837 RepID=A0A6A5S590_9PLEO|nr:uncharacterized protein M421DRAFT_202021 [Didymella exigua CBS 183.55]KAF1933656.1 hypothetical protein M421DRAFT_202021 [Didymella exigua CBS 183.55]